MTQSPEECPEKSPSTERKKNTPVLTWIFLWCKLSRLNIGCHWNCLMILLMMIFRMRNGWKEQRRKRNCIMLWLPKDLSWIIRLGIGNGNLFWLQGMIKRNKFLRWLCRIVRIREGGSMGNRCRLRGSIFVWMLRIRGNLLREWRKLIRNVSTMIHSSDTTTTSTTCPCKT